MPTLSATIDRAGDAVTLRWSLNNDTDSIVWIADRFLQHAEPALRVVGNRAVLRDPPDGSVPLYATVGYTAPHGMAFAELYPAVRSIPAHTTYTGVITFPLPLTTWHPAESEGRSVEPRSQLTLAVGWFAEPPATVTVDTDLGALSMLTAASARQQQWLKQTVAWP